MFSIAKINRQAPFEAINLIRFDHTGWQVLGVATKDAALILGALWGARVTGIA